jgi:hypothetical protein
MASNNRAIRVPKTPLGTIFIEPYMPDHLDFHPWWGGTCWLEGRALPFFRAILNRKNGIWTLGAFSGNDPDDAPKWPRGSRDKVRRLVVEIGSIWAADHEVVIRERGADWMQWQVERVFDSSMADIRTIQQCIGWARSLDRFDLLAPLKPLLQTISGEFSQVTRRLSARSRLDERRQAA